MATRDPRVDQYIARAPEFARPILTYFREVVHSACPDVTETIKWSVPSFEYRGPMCGMAAFKAHCTFGFWKATLLAERDPAMPRADHPAGPFRRISSLAELPDEKTLRRIVRLAAQLNADGIKAPRPRTSPRPPIRMPRELAAALRKNRRAQAAFEAFSPSHRREYIEWITEARTDATRDRRLAQAIEWIAEGKSRNWKYARR